jgi:hypothetical protein
MIVFIAVATFFASALLLHWLLVSRRQLTKRTWLKLDYVANLAAAAAVAVAAMDYQAYTASVRSQETVTEYATALSELRDAIRGTVTFCRDNRHLKETQTSSTCKYAPAFLADLEKMKSEPGYPFVDLLIFTYDKATLELYTGTPCDSGNGLFKEKLTQPVHHGKWLHTERIEFCDFYRQVLEFRQQAYAARSTVETFARFKALSGLWIVLLAFVLALRLTKIAGEVAALPPGTVSPVNRASSGPAEPPKITGT